MARAGSRAPGRFVRVLYLLRHAKSLPAEPGESDFDRPLAPRGRGALSAVIRHVQRHGVAPELVLCSSARRTAETLRGIGPALPRGAVVELERRLYLASARTLLARLRRIDDGITTVMLVGHNPGLQRLAVLLAGSGDDETCARLREKFPTAALAKLVFHTTHWRELAAGAGGLALFVTPKDLDG